MTKHLCAFVYIVLSLFLFPLAAMASTYTDAMESNLPDDVKTYYNLSPVVFQGSGAWSALYDKSFLSFSNASQPAGRVVYKVRNCQRITVGIYTHTGSFVYRPSGTLSLGFDTDDLARSQRPGGSEQALFSPSAQAAYTRQGGALYQAVFGSHYVFMEPSSLWPGSSGSSGDLISYGVNVYVSSNGMDFTRISLSHGKLDYKARSNYCYEEFTGTVPESAQAIMVEINDFSRYYDLLDYKWYPKNSRCMTSLAAVTLSGVSMETGTPKPASSSTADSSEESSGANGSSESASSGSSPDRDSSSGGSSTESGSDKDSSSGGSSAKSSSSSGSSAKSSSSKGGANDDEVGDSKASSSKFEGVIGTGGGTYSPPSASAKPSSESEVVSAPAASVKSSSSTKQSSSKQGSSETPSSSEAESVSVQSSSQEEPKVTSIGEIVYYQAPGGGESNSAFTSGILIYIVGVCCAIVFVLLRSRKK